MSINEKIIKVFQEEYPFVKLFTFNNLVYFYDAKSNLLAQITQKDLIAICDENSNDEFIKILKRNGVFSKGYLKQIVPNDYELEQIIEDQLVSYVPRKFIVEVTDECTLRCKYCLYSNKENLRVHSKNYIKEDIAIKAIDYYFNIYYEAIKKIPKSNLLDVLKIAAPGISWWGGEPLLNISLMQSMKNHLESLPWKDFGIYDFEFVYSVVTNFTVLNQEIIDFLISTNIFVFISLDGGKVEHDKNRVFINGKGSFKKVISNIDFMIQNYPDFCKKRMIIQSVRANNIDLLSAYDFIDEHFKISKGTKTILKHISFPQKIDKEYLPQESYSHNSFNPIPLLNTYNSRLDELSKLSNEELSNLLKVEDSTLNDFEDLLKLENIIAFDHPMGSDYISKHFSCPIGIDNIFVSLNGDLHMCSKTDQSIPLGNVNIGIDKKKLYDLYSKYYSFFRQKCNKCWAFLFCKVCPANILYKGEFYHPLEKECDIIRNNLFTRIYKYIIFSQYDSLYEKIKKNHNNNKENNFLNFEEPVKINHSSYEKNKKIKGSDIKRK